MHVLKVRNVQQALPEGLRLLQQRGVDRASRNGPVRMMEEPVTTLYYKPTERVLFWPQRNANPFFHFFESLWMLAGRNDVEYVANFVKNMRSFSDDGETLHGAYGHRWLHHFEMDQLQHIIQALFVNPNNRRQILQMWDPRVDLVDQGNDVPCNVTAHFQLGSYGLDMTVFCRSNDVIWGAYGANAVHFSYLQEYIATALKAPVGRYWQISDNYHVYKAVADKMWDLARYCDDGYSYSNSHRDPYANGSLEPCPLMSTSKGHWDQELKMFLEHPEALGFTDPFFRRVAAPLRFAHNAYKEGDLDLAWTFADGCAAKDWRWAATSWIKNAAKRRKEKTAND